MSRTKIDATLDLGWSYRWIRDRYAVSLGTLSRHANHRTTAADEEPSLEQCVGQLAEDQAQLRLVVENELQLVRRVLESLAVPDMQDDDFFALL